MSDLPFVQHVQSNYNQLKQWLTVHWRILILEVSLPLLLFGILALKIGQSESGLKWDTAILVAIHETANQTLNNLAVSLTQWGRVGGTFLLATPVLLALGWQQKWRAFSYLITAIISSGLINFTAKLFLHRLRPHLWESSYPLPLDFSFPSGHAMASMTLVMALIILAWGRRWGVVAGIFGGLFVLAIAWTRLYLGVHFPSDILAGWLLSIAWTVTVSLLFNLRPKINI